jgi:NTE family protein
MSGVGLVLGAGGVVGQAYQAGVLSALECEVGFDPRNAEVIVGTSAGSVTATLLRLGIPASDLAAQALGTPLTDRGKALLDQLLPAAPGFPPIRPGSLLRPWRPPSPALVARAARRPWAFRPQVAAMTLLPAGEVDLTERARALDSLVGDAWPNGLWICAVRRSDGARVVFGRPGSPRAPLAAAVIASCAIPGYFSPVAIGGVEYFDGGVHSSTNANVLAPRRLATVVVVSPMSSASQYAGSADGPLRWSLHRRLEREAARLEANGTRVIRIEPGPAVRTAMGLRAMAEDRSDRVVQAAYDEVLAAPPRLSVLEDLAG